MTAAPLLLDLSHTSHSRARTGVQRVARALTKALGSTAIGITYDPYAEGWRTLQPWEQTNLTNDAPGVKRGAHWPIAARLCGRARKLLGLPPSVGGHSAAGVLIPEIFSTRVAQHLADLPRPRVAVFHDAISLKLPEFTPRKTVARFPSYLRELLQFDGVAAVSDDSRDALLSYWDWLGARTRPVVRTVPLGVDPVPASVGGAEAASAVPVVLCVGSIEGRKNHLALLEACEQLWSHGRTFELQVVGLPRPETASAALARLRELQARGRPLRHDGAADDAALDRAYRRSSFTVYPSLMEGFGLPVLESLAHGRACICSSRGALGEAASDGGCLTLPSVDAASLSTAIDRLLRGPEEHARLTAEARRRTFRTWSEYARDLGEFVTRLK